MLFRSERAHKDTGKSIEGTGLGLSIARRLAVMHGGSIALKSEVGRGTTATVVLPSERVIRKGAPAAAPQGVSIA